MSMAFKPDVSTLQIVEVDVSTSQKMGKPSCMSASHSAEQKFVTNCMNGLSRKLKSYATTRQPHENKRFLCRKNMVQKCIFSIHFCDYMICVFTRLTADIDFDNPLTLTLKSDNPASCSDIFFLFLKYYYRYMCLHLKISCQ